MLPLQELPGFVQQPCLVSMTPRPIRCQQKRLKEKVQYETNINIHNAEASAISLCRGKDPHMSLDIASYFRNKYLLSTQNCLGFCIFCKLPAMRQGVVLPTTFRQPLKTVKVSLPAMLQGVVLPTTFRQPSKTVKVSPTPVKLVSLLSPRLFSVLFGGGIISPECIARGKRCPSGFDLEIRCRMSSTALGSNFAGIQIPS